MYVILCDLLWIYCISFIIFLLVKEPVTSVEKKVAILTDRIMHTDSLPLLVLIGVNNWYQRSINRIKKPDGWREDHMEDMKYKM